MNRWSKVSIDWSKRAGIFALVFIFCLLAGRLGYGAPEWVGCTFTVFALLTTVWALWEKSARMRQHRELEECREKFKLAVDGASSGHWEWDVRTGEINFSKRWKSMLGYEEHEIPASITAWQALVHPEDLPEARRTLQEYFASDTKDYLLEHRLLTKSGEYRWILAKGVSVRNRNGKVVRMTGWHIDIHPIRERDQALADQQATLKMITSHLGDVIWLTDATKGRMVYISPSYEKVWERSCKSLYENPLSFVAAIHEEDRARVLNAFSRQTEGKYNEVYRVMVPSGQTKWIRDRAFPIRNEKGDLTFVVGIASDITQQRAQEETIQEQQVRLAASARLSALGEMAGGLAHEINNPLAVIQGKASQLRRRLDDGPVDKEYVTAAVTKIEETCQRIVKIIKGLRTIARQGENDPTEKARVVDLVNDTLELCRERYKSVAVDLRVGQIEDIEVECRPSQIGQVLLNLLNNAQDAALSTEARWVEISAAREGDTLRFLVTDSGKEIPEEVASRMMQPFFTTKEVGKGTGLGLSISLGLARGHGGNLFLDHGSAHTCFVLEIPLTQPRKPGA